MVPGFDLFLADALSRQNGRAGGVCSDWRRAVVVERLDRVLKRRVVEEPGEVLGVTLRQLDGQARDHTAGRARGPTYACRATGRLHVRRGRSETDDVDVRENGLAHDLGRPGRGAGREHAGAGGRDDGDVVNQRDVAGHALLP